MVNDRPVIHPNELPVYARWPMRLTRGEGSYVWDEDGTRYLDLYGGHAVALTGHCHPKVVTAVKNQVESLMFYSNVVPSSPRDELFDRLADNAPKNLDTIFLVNSGAEANEQAIALARRGTGRSEIVSVAGGFHGRTISTLAASGIPKYRQLAEATGVGGRAMVAQTTVCPFNDIVTLEKVVGPTVAAVIVEPVQGLAGARALSADFLRAAREFTKRHGALLIFDEIQSGCGRCGAFTAAESFAVSPDLLTLAKGLGSGIPIGALLSTRRATAEVGPGDLGTTFGGGPIACAAACATIDVIVENRLAEKASRSFEMLKAELERMSGVVKVQGKGLLVGVVLDRPANAVRASLARDHKILAGTAIQPDVLRLLPPLTVTSAELGVFAGALKRCLS